MLAVSRNGRILNAAFRPARGTAPVLAFSNSLGTDFRIWDDLVTRLPGDWGAPQFPSGSGPKLVAARSQDLVGVSAELTQLGGGAKARAIRVLYVHQAVNILCSLMVAKSETRPEQDEVVT